MYENRLRQSEKKLIMSLAALFCVLLAGTMGYVYLEGWDFIDALYMTVITLTTIGFKEVHDMDRAGQVFTIVLVIFGVGTVAFSVKNATRLMLEGELRYLFGRKKLEKEIRRLRDHYIVCGYGRMGRFICRELASRPVPFIVIEKSTEAVPEADMEKYLFLIGDADKDDTLLEAGIDRAKGLITVVSTDADNLYIVLTARGLNPNLFIVARAGEEGSEQKLRRAGASKVISPYLIGAHKMAQAVLRPAVLDFLEFATRSENMDLNIEEVRVSSGSSMSGRQIKDSGIRQELDIIIVAVKKAGGEMNFNPSPAYVLEDGDVLIVLGRPEMLRRLEGMTGGKA